MLTFYTNPMSRGRLVRWMLEETGQPYETVVVPYGPEMRDPAYLALNPMAKVPTLVHGDTVVTECAAICAYLADAFPDAGLAPPPAGRGAYYRWLFFAAGPVEAAVTARALGWEAPERRGMIGFGDFPSVMDTIERAVETAAPFLTGERFTAADVYLGSQIGWGLQFGSIEKRPAFETYWARLADRPARLRATAADDALMPPEAGTG
jgi:glutathione S-transferase